MNILTKFLSTQAQLRVYHWQTKSYAEHQALGGLYGALDGLIDNFVEVFSGRSGGTLASKEAFAFTANNYTSNAEVMAFLNGFSAYLTNEIPGFLSPSDTELLNIRDEMLGEVNKAKYLLRLK